MLKDGNGQISVEYILLVGLVLVIVLTFAGPIGTILETDQAMDSAKAGILNATNDIAYNNTGNIFRLEGMSLNNGTLTANIYSMKTPSESNKEYIQSKAINTIAQTLNKPVEGSKVVGNHYNYTVTLVWV